MLTFSAGLTHDEEGRSCSRGVVTGVGVLDLHLALHLVRQAEGADGRRLCPAEATPPILPPARRTGTHLGSPFRAGGGTSGGHSGVAGPGTHAGTHTHTHLRRPHLTVYPPTLGLRWRSGSLSNLPSVPLRPAHPSCHSYPAR